MHSAPPRSEFTLGWKVLVAAMLGVACGASPIPYNAIGFLLGPLHDEFGWSFRDVSLGLTVCGIAGSLLVPVYGSLSDRLGVRPVALSPCWPSALSFAALALIPGSLPGYWLMWLVVGIVGFGSTPRDLDPRRQPLVLSPPRTGPWHHAGRHQPDCHPRAATGGLQRPALRVAPDLSRARPAAAADRAAAGPAPVPGAPGRPAATRTRRWTAQLPGITLRQAAGGYRFWLIWLSVLCVAFAYGGVFVHLAADAGRPGLHAYRGRRHRQHPGPAPSWRAGWARASCWTASGRRWSRCRC